MEFEMGDGVGFPLVEFITIITSEAFRIAGNIGNPISAGKLITEQLPIGLYYTGVLNILSLKCPNSSLEQIYGQSVCP